MYFSIKLLWIESEKERNYYCLLWILSRWRILDYNRKMVSRNWKCKEAKKVIGNVRIVEAMGCGWYVFNSRACLSPEINRFSRTNSSIRRTEFYLTKIKSCCRVVSCSEIVSPSLFEVHTRAYVFNYVGFHGFSVSDCLRCQGKNDNKENTQCILEWQSRA